MSFRSLVLLLLLPAAAFAARGGKLTIRVVDAATEQPVAARMHLKSARGKVVRPVRAPFWKDHFAIDGEITLKLGTGIYNFELERGHEYKPYTGYFEIKENAEDEKVVPLHRIVDMSRLGWYSGDLHVHRPVDEIELLMRADDLHVAPVITWWQSKQRVRLPEKPVQGLIKFDGGRFYHDLAGEDERAGGALLYFNLEKPIDFGEVTAEYPSAARFLVAARAHEGVHVDIEKPFWWDVPVWLASGKVDSIGLAHNHMHREGVYPGEAWGRPRDPLLYPGVHGNGRWTETIYYHALDAGLKIPPSAGSASGVLPNPVGYNRVYVYCGDDFTYENWWRNLRAGRVFVTNGPLICVDVEGHKPGHVFRGESGQAIELAIGLTLHTKEKIEYLEIVKNGRAEHTVRLDELAKQNGRLPLLKFTESGWFLVRAVTNNPRTYRFASTGPYYVEFDYQPRISKRSARFFLDWIDERMPQIKIDDPQKLQEVLLYQRAARKFWQKRHDEATAE